MTEDQWWHLQAQISAQNALLFALAKADRNQIELKKQFESNCEIMKSAGLPLPVPEKALEMMERQMQKMSEVLWGKT